MPAAFPDDHRSKVDNMIWMDGFYVGLSEFDGNWAMMIESDSTMASTFLEKYRHFGIIQKSKCPINPQAIGMMSDLR
jgi:hypothetical protein